MSAHGRQQLLAREGRAQSELRLAGRGELSRALSASADLSARAREQAYLEGLQDGRAEASAYWPVVDEEGFRRGWAAAQHQLAAMLRRAVRENPAARSLLLDLLEGRGD